MDESVKTLSESNLSISDLKQVVTKFFNSRGNYYKRGSFAIGAGGYDKVAEIYIVSDYGSYAIIGINDGGYNSDDSRVYEIELYDNMYEKEFNAVVSTLKNIYPEYEIEEIKYDTSALDDDDVFESTVNGSRKRSSCLKESVSEKFEMQSLANDLNKINDGKYWVGVDASLYKDSNGHWRVKVNILNTNYETVMDSCDVVVSNRGGYVIHLYNPTASQWYDTKDDVLYYFERRVKSNKK